MPTLLCLAAGASSRYGRPKQLDPVGPSGARLLDFTIADAIRAGARHVVVVARQEHRGELEGACRSRWGDLINVEIAVQPPGVLGGEPWGTVGAVLAAAPQLSEPFLVANADDFYGRQAIAATAQALGGTLPHEPCGVVTAYPVGLTLSAAGGVHRALLYTSGERLTGIEELRDLTATSDGGVADGGDPPRRLSRNAPVSMNLWGFTVPVLERFASAFETFRAHRRSGELRIADVVAELVSRQRLGVQVVGARGPWAGLTHPEDRPTTASLLRALTAAGEYPDPVWAVPS